MDSRLVPRPAAPRALPVLCGWCGCHLRGPQSQPGEPVKHGICQACRDRFRADRTTPPHHAA